jgi:Protein of unknown function (DUF2628)
MAVYMVLEPPRVDGDVVRRAERIVFVRDRFAWGAFLLGPLWLLWRRLWLALIGYIVVVGLVMVALRLAGAGPNWRTLAGVLIGLLLGFEAANLRRWTLARRGWRDLGIVIGDDREAAERRFFDGYTERAAERGETVAPAAPYAPPPVRPGPAGDVIGLFPQPGANR